MPDGRNRCTPVRNIGQAIGMSVTSFTLTRGIQANHADIAAGITPINRVLQGHDTVQRMLDPFTRHGVALLDRMVDQQAQIIAHNNDFRLMSLVIVPPVILLLFMRRTAPTVLPAAVPAK